PLPVERGGYREVASRNPYLLHAPQHNAPRGRCAAPGERCKLPGAMPKVLIAAGPERTTVLERTIVWRRDVERVFARGIEGAFDTARQVLPKLVILDGGAQEQALETLRRFRGDGVTRKMSLAVLRQTATVPEVEALRRAGANVVFAGEALP